MVERRGLRPFLKWVGGKRQLLPVLRRFYPNTHGAYFEPFLGSGAVFFDLLGQGLLDGHAVTLSDDNADLIGCYARVGDSLDAVLAALDSLAAGHGEGGRDHYLQVRDSRFNPARAVWRDAGSDITTYPAELAAMLIYLNRTGYNGLFRLNSTGEHNVPPGRYDRPRIVDRLLLELASRTFTLPDVRVQVAGFQRVLDEALADDFVYFDPRYAPLSATANFRGYTGRGFGDADQQRLQQVLIALATRGVKVLLSNSTAPAVTRRTKAMLPSAPRACARGASPPGAPSTQRQTGAAPSRNWWSRTSGQHLRYRRPGSLVRVLRTRHHADPAGGVAWLPVGRVGLRPHPESAGLSRPASILRRRSTSTRACGTRCRTTGHVVGRKRGRLERSLRLDLAQLATDLGGLNTLVRPAKKPRLRGK